MPYPSPKPSLARRALRSMGSTVADAFNELFPSVIEQEIAIAMEAGWTIGSSNAYCHRCGASTGPGEATDLGCSQCIAQTIQWDGMVRLGHYEAPIERWILAMKFAQTWHWAKWFGRELAGVISEVGDPKRTLVCHVPMPYRRRWLRGYDQARLISQAMAKSADLPLVRMLRRKGNPPPQISKPASHRIANVRNTFDIAKIEIGRAHV